MEGPVSASWSTLPPRLAAVLLRRLPCHADQVRFAAVCRRWRSQALRQPRHPPLPWLALPDGRLFSFPRATPDAVISCPEGARYRGSCSDWLVFLLHEVDEYLLLNPFSRDTMRLPKLLPHDWTGHPGNIPKRRKITVRKMAMCSRGIVAAIVGDCRLGKVALCRPAPAALWSLSPHDPWRPLMDIAFYDGKVYAVDEDENLFAMDVGEAAGDNGEPAEASGVHLCVVGTPPMLPGNQRQTAMLYLVVSGDMMLMVRRVIGGDFTSEFALFNADFGSSRWLELTSIGDDVALFIGAGGSGARRVSQFELFRYELRANRIHFLHDDEFWLRSIDKGRRGCCPTHFGAYDMTDGKIYPFLPPMELHNGGKVPATWLFPRAQDGASRWSELPMDVLYKAMCCLPSIQDILGLATICRHWHATVRLHLPCSLPELCLAHPNERFLAFQGCVFTPHNFSRGSKYHGATSSQLLFITNDDGVYNLVNPFTGRKRSLPTPSCIRVDDEPIEIINEPVPKEGPRPWRERDTEEISVRKLVVCPDGLAAAIIGREHSAKIALYTPEGLTCSWSLNAHDQWRRYADMVFFDGKLYALMNNEDLLTLDVGYTESGEPRITRVECVIDGSRSRYTLQEHSHVRYLLRSRSGGLLMVCRIMLECGLTTYEFLVFKADLRSSQWVEINTLGGDGALFVGRLCSRAVPADGYGVRGDQIFFLNDSAGMARTKAPGLSSRDAFASVYNMKDGSISELLPMHFHEDGAVPATWLFRHDPDAEE
ncbi:unnamed protein product [Alopecurus aequalis]